MLDISEKLNITLKNMRGRSFDARLVSTSAEATKMVLDMVPLKATIGVGDSATLRQMGVLVELEKRGNTILDFHDKRVIEGVGESRAKYKKMMRIAWKALTSDVFITSANAITEDGKIVSIDGSGNRVAAMIYGPRQVILCVGRNKIVKDEVEAEWRIKNVINIAHGMNYRGDVALDDKQLMPAQPCVKAGKCIDCRGPLRNCNAKVIMEHKTRLTDIAVILINEDLGLGWDPSWNKDHIERIYNNYCQSSPPIRTPRRRDWR